MNRYLSRLLKGLGRLVSLVLLAGLGTVILMRVAPGFFNDARELDPEYAARARMQLEDQEHQQGSVIHLAASMLGGWFYGDFGRSRQYEVPVTELIGPRSRVTARLLICGVLAGWSSALILAVPVGLRRGTRGDFLIAAANIALLAVPMGALCTCFLLTDHGGPVAALTILIAVRDFKLVYRLIRRSRMAAYLTYARAQGLTRSRIAFFHLLPSVSRELLSIAAVSVVLALSSIVPVEVIFDVPGLGQLAWSAAMNRDLPVLLGVTVLMAACVGLVTIATNSRFSEEAQ